MRNYFQIAQADPGNSQLNLAPINNALSGIRQNQYQNALMERRDAETAYQQGRDQKQDARQAESDKWAKIERLGKSAFAYSQLPPEQRDPRTWGRMVQAMQQFDPNVGTEPDDIDPIKGPAKFAAVYGGMVRDPMDQKLKEADLAYKQAQTSKAYADAKNDGSDFGKTGTIVRGADGNLYSVRYRADGTEQINPLQVGGQTVQQDRGTDVVGDVIVDKSTGQEVRNVGANIAAGETAKVVGKETGERKMAMPKARASLRALETQHRNITTTIDRIMPKVNQWTTGLAGQALSNLGGTDANDLRTLLNTVKANLGFDKLQDMRDNSPTGGALGQVAVAELEMLQSAFASVEQSQTADQLRDNLTYLNGLLKEMQDNRRLAFDDSYGADNRPPAAAGADPKASLKQKYGVDLE